MGSRTKRVVGAAFALGALVLCSASACGITCPDGQPAPCNDSSGSGTGGMGGTGGGSPAVDGVQQRGAIFCSVCAQSPFCYDPTQTPAAYVYLTDPLLPCPDGAFFPASPATRRNDGAAFYCIRPSVGAELDIQTIYCPDPDPNSDNLKKHSYVDPCADGDGICVPVACGGATECESQNTELVVMCAPSALAAQQKIVDKAGTYHQPNVPGNLDADPNDPSEPPPARYCFVTCFDQNYATDPKPCDLADDP